MQNPNINRITFHTFRQWYATMLYHKNGGKLLQVQEKLGHKSILTTTIYTHLINLEADAYNSAVANTVEEARKLVKAGLEFVCDMDDHKLFRKPK
jgi:integrase